MSIFVDFFNPVENKYSADQTGGADSLDKRVASFAPLILMELGASLAINYLVLSTVGANFTLLLTSGYLVLSIAHVAYVVAAEILLGVRYIQDPFVADRQAAEFSLVYTVMHAGIGALIHESGHALAALSLFNQARPQVSIYPFRGGSTSYAISYGLTFVGNFFGKEISLGLIKAAGMVSSTLTATIALVFASTMSEEYSEISDYLEYAAVSLVINEVVNGLSTLVVERTALIFAALTVSGIALLALSYCVQESYPKLSQWLETAVKVAALNELVMCCWNFSATNSRLSNDFYNLWVNFAIHPLVPIACVLSVPLTAKIIAETFTGSSSA